MTIQEKRYFLEAMSMQIELYNKDILAKRKHFGTIGSCSICKSYIQRKDGEWHHPKKSCNACPNINFRIYDFDETEEYACSYRMTYPSKIRDLLSGDQLMNNYKSYGERAAKQFWEKVYQLAKKTPATLISFEENHAFVRQMIWIDKTIALEWENKIKAEQSESV